MRRTTPLLALIPLALALAACGDDDGGGDESAFCDVAAEVDESGDDPTPEQLEELADTAPSEIRDAVEVVVEFGRALAEGDEEAFERLDDEEIQEAGEALEAFLTDECGLVLDEDTSDDGDDEEAAGDLEGFCGVADELLAQEQSSTEEIEELLEVAPDELRDDIELLLEFSEARDEVGDDAIEDFDFDELNAAGQAVQDFAVEECGIEPPTGSGGADDDGADDDGEDAEPLGDDEAPELGGPSSPPAIDDPDLAELADDCFEGDMAACDNLYFSTPVDSPEEAYGETCGGRLAAADALAAECELTFGAQVDD